MIFIVPVGRLTSALTLAVEVTVNNCREVIIVI